MEKQMKEEWRPVRGKEEYAEISNMGQIHRFRREYYCGKNHKSKCICEETWTYGSETSDGYLNARIGGVQKGVHVWVYMTFNDCDIPQGLEVNHLDENPKNNRLDNLNLLSHGDNMRYGTGIERRAAANKGKKLSEERKAKISAAEKNHPNMSKAVQALDPKTLEVVMEFPSTREAERQFGFNHSAVSQCCRGKLNIYKGLIWRYAEK